MNQDGSACHAGARFARWFGESRAGLAVIWLMFLVLRLAVLAIPVTPSSDAGFYYSRARQLAAGMGYLDKVGAPTAFWPPGLSITLSLLFRLTGASPLAVGLFNCGAAVVAGWLVYDLGRRLFGGELAGRTALLLLALYPNAIGYVPLALTEVFYTSLLLGGCWLLAVGWQRAGWAALVPAGLIFGLATLVKAQSLLVVPMIFAILWLRRGDVWRRLPGLLLQGVLVMACAAVVIVPWTVRNHRELHHWVMVSTNGGITLLTGNNDSARGDYTPNDSLVDRAWQPPGRSEVAYDAEARRLAVQWIETHPARFATLVPLKLFRLWAPDGEAEWGYEGGYAGYARYETVFRMVRGINQLYYVLLMAGFVAAAWLTVRRRRRAGERLIDWWVLPYAIAAYPSLIAVVFSGQSRFHYPVMPFVCIACGSLIAHYCRIAGGKNQLEEFARAQRNC